ncbi:hypothetical protein G6F37_004825 [Rhizopus arrhizus]|nr:hypothetical protein G6F38_012353 [Rhizopus arrhizus]KAG1159504.1 hypothetical protein G6F37_004825 [Rhizopus arrhizus]
MSSLANLISNIKANTASNPLVQKGQKRKIDNTEIKRPKKAKETIQKSNGPSVVVFDGSVLQKKPVYEEKAEKKRFLDSRITTVEKVEEKKKLTPKEAEEEAENERHDVELKQLLATSKLLEELERDEMTSKERRRHTMQKLETLGVKPLAKEKMPLPLKLKLDEVHKRRNLAKLQEAKDLGIYHKSLKHLYVKTAPKKRNRDPGITTGVGKMKGATLTLQKSEILKIQRQGGKSNKKFKKK